METPAAPLVTDALPVLLLAATILIGAVIWVVQTVPRAPKRPRPVPPDDSLHAKLGVARVSAPLLAVAATVWTTLLLAFLAGLFWVLFDLPRHDPSDLRDFRTSLLALAAMAAGLSALVALPFTLIRTRQAERQTHAREQDLVTDRINKAVENLGAEKTVSAPLNDAEGNTIYKRDENGETPEPIILTETRPNLEVRIGGLFALDRIARENLGFHVQIMQILCAYVRQNAPASEAEPPPDLDLPEPEDGDDLLEVWENWRIGYRRRLETFKRELRPPRDDIQIAMELIGRRSQRQREVEAAWLMDGVDEAKSPFDADLPPLLAAPAEGEAGWQSTGKEIRSAADDFRNAMAKPRAYRPDLRNANLQGLDLSGLDLRGCLLAKTRMQGAVLWEAQMQGAFLREAQMQGADLWEAQMQGAFLREAQMQGADLREAQMQGADLREAQMQRSVAANRADVNYARFAATDLCDVGFTHDQIKGAFGDASVTLPSGLTAGEPPLTRWPTRELSRFPRDENDQTEYDRHYAAWLDNPDTYDPNADY